MKNLSILPADTYSVINRTVINDTDLKIVSMLYQPIIGFAAVALYTTLLDDLNKSTLMSEEQTHHHLMATMQLRLEDIVIAREKLEAVGLIKSYVKKASINHYVYLVYSPISAHEFFNHPILNVVLYNNLGKKEYEKFLEHASESLSIPKDVIAGQPMISLNGNHSIRVVNYRSVEEYTTELIRLSLGKKHMEICGKQLLIESLRKEEIIIVGNILNISHRFCFPCFGHARMKNLITSLMFR